MIRFLFALVAWPFLSCFAYCDAVLYSNYANTGTAVRKVINQPSSTPIYSGTGLAFSTGSGAQAWRLDSLSLYLTTKSISGVPDTYTGAINAFLYAVDNTKTFNQAGFLTFVGSSTTNYTSGSTISGTSTPITVNLNTFANSDNSKAIQAGKQYFLGLTFAGAMNSTNSYLNWDSYTGTGGNGMSTRDGWALGNTYTVSNANWTSSTSLANSSLGFSNTGFVQMDLNATAVPEAGTWALFMAGALIVVCGGIWNTKKTSNVSGPIPL